MAAVFGGQWSTTVLSSSVIWGALPIPWLHFSCNCVSHITHTSSHGLRSTAESQSWDLGTTQSLRQLCGGRSIETQVTGQHPSQPYVLSIKLQGTHISDFQKLAEHLEEINPRRYFSVTTVSYKRKEMSSKDLGTFSTWGPLFQILQRRLNEIIFRLNPFLVFRAEVEGREGSGGKTASEISEMCSDAKICCPGVLLVGQG